METTTVAFSIKAFLFSLFSISIPTACPLGALFHLEFATAAFPSAKTIYQLFSTALVCKYCIKTVADLPAPITRISGFILACISH